MTNPRNDPRAETRPAWRAISLKHPRGLRRNLFRLALAGLLALNGCARHYVITLTNGTQIGAVGKPKLRDNVYLFKDAAGRESRIAAGRVSEIAPASTVQDRKTMFNAAPAK